MAVDLIELAAALRLGDGVNAPEEPIAGRIARLLGVAEAFVTMAAPEAPEHIADEAAIRMAATLYDSPSAPAGDRYAAAWRNSSAEALVSRWVVRRAGSEGEGVPTAATPTPPAVLVDGELYTAYGNITVPGWRDYDFFQFLFTNGTDTFPSTPVNAKQLIALSPLVVGLSRNVGWRLTIDAADDDVITIASTGGNAIAAPTATSTMTVIAWRS